MAMVKCISKKKMTLLFNFFIKCTGSRYQNLMDFYWLKHQNILVLGFYKISQYQKFTKSQAVALSGIETIETIQYTSHDWKAQRNCYCCFIHIIFFSSTWKHVAYVCVLSSYIAQMQITKRVSHLVLVKIYSVHVMN